MRYLRRTSNYPERKILYDLTHMTSKANLVAVDVETLTVDSGCSLKKEFTELIYMNPRMVLCQTINQVDSCHGCVYGPLCEG